MVHEISPSFEAELDERLLQCARLLESSRALIGETHTCISRTRRAIDCSRVRLKPLALRDPLSLIFDGYPLESGA
jgi:hypothetical protein